MEQPRAYQISLPVFEGPFDLLLHLIRENQVDIYDIPIAEITDQYLEYLRAMEEMDLEIASSFLVMAATLLSIKAKMLLPLPPSEDEDEPEDARETLVHDILEYMRFKNVAGEMSALREANRRFIARPNEQELYVNLFQEENPLDGKTLADLQAAFAKVLEKAEGREDVLSIQREQVTLRDRLEHLYQMIAAQPEGVTFSQAFDGCHGKIELIVTFLALLELVRQRVIKINQGKAFDEIYLYGGELNHYDRDACI